MSLVGPHRVRTGQNVFVTDPKMAGYLPAPLRSGHDEYSPGEVILRIHTPKSKQQDEIVMHAVAATATFGKPFGSTAGAGSLSFDTPAVGVRPSSDNVNGCRPFTSTDELPLIRNRVLLIDRGDCTFLEKVNHAHHAGAAGVVIVGFPPAKEAQYPIAGDGLIRPSAEGEAPDRLYALKEAGFPVLYVDWTTGEAMRLLMDTVEEGELSVEVMRLEDDTVGSDSVWSREERTEGSGSGSEGAMREGRVMVEGWTIWNLLIIERPP